MDIEKRTNGVMGRRRIGQVMSWVLLALVVMWGTVTATHLAQGSNRSPEAIVMLGGSIRREIYIADRRSQGFAGPIVISRGSEAPCIYLLFQKIQADLDNTWLENCANSTFDNFRYSLPLLQAWGIRRVQVVTSPSHGPRAGWLARVILGSHGIWVDMDLVAEQGVPGNQESRLKTLLDVARGLGWAMLSQIYAPPCPDVTPLAAVDMAQWQAQGFQCEHQSGIEGSPGTQE
ncbi:MAG: YdcF family protein [Cyanobacteria bacterium]|nr:YdcF family protein [Cyanobacteriota bacterium]MDA0866671.1 YdcF family protein [Cyanobacteriota bacterium]